MSILKVLRERTGPLNVAELANLLLVSEATVQRWVRRRQIPFIRIGDVLRFDGSLLADWLELQGACTRPIHPRPSGNTSECRMTWQELGELAPVEVRGSATPRESEKTEAE
jgi:excisionase family DNA binding protein